MADMDSSLSPSYFHPYPFMQDHPFQHGTSSSQGYDFSDHSDVQNRTASNPFMQEQDHPFQHGYDFYDHSAVQNRAALNPTVVETPESFPPPWNVADYYDHDSGFGWLDHVESSTNNSTHHTLEELESAMEGLSLGNPFGNTTHSVGQYSGSNDFGTNNLFMNEAGFDYDYERQLLFQKRIHAAATALRGRDLFSHSDYHPNTSNLMTERNFLQLFNRNSHMSHGYGVSSSYDHNYRLGMNRSRSFVWSSPQVQQQRHNFSSLEGVRGKVVSMAKDQCGCRFLQMKIDRGTPQDIDMILSEVKDHMHDLMTHHFGNYLIQKIFEARTVSEVQMNYIFLSVIQDVRKLKDVCMNNHGTRAIQRMIENLKTQMQMDEVIRVMWQITVPLMKNVNGGYVIQQCVKLFPTIYKRVILNEIARNCVEIATDKSGCSVIQKCMIHAVGEAIIPLVQAIISNAAVLAEDEYGNYVMKFLVEMGMPLNNAKIISELRGKYVELSMNKYASNVVQHLLKYSEVQHAAIIVLEIMGSHEFLHVLQDPFGNYVSQTALECSKGALQKRLLNSVFSYHGNLCNHVYGKRVLDCAKRLKIRF